MSRLSGDYFQIPYHRHRNVDSVYAFVGAKGLPNRNVSFFGTGFAQRNKEPCGLNDALAIVFVFVEVKPSAFA
jgi:hypothetical protein